MTPTILNTQPTPPGPAPTNRQADSNSGDMSFKQALSQQVEDRRNASNAEKARENNRTRDSNRADEASKADAALKTAQKPSDTNVPNSPKTNNDTQQNSADSNTDTVKSVSKKYGNDVDDNAQATDQSTVLTATELLAQAAAALVLTTAKSGDAGTPGETRNATAAIASASAVIAGDKKDLSTRLAKPDLSAKGLTDTASSEAAGNSTVASESVGKTKTGFATTLDASVKSNAADLVAGKASSSATSASSSATSASASASAAATGLNAAGLQGSASAIATDASINAAAAAKAFGIPTELSAAKALDAGTSGPPQLTQITQAALNLNAITGTNANPVNTSLTPHVGSPAWDQALGQKVVWMAAGAQQSASMTLNPPDLGPLQVVLKVSNGQAEANFFAAQPEVRQALEAALPKLREMMSEAGIQLGQANVSAGMPNQQNESGKTAQHTSNNRFDQSDGVTETVVRPARSGTMTGGQGLVDTFA